MTAVSEWDALSVSSLTTAWLALVCVNCTFDSTFVLDASPESAQACAASGATYNVALTSFAGFADPVALSVSAGLPAGATAGFTPPTPTPPASSTLAIGTGAVAFGNYTLTVTGTSGTTVRNDDVSLQVSTITPLAPTLTAPADGATGVSVTPTLSWAAVTEAVDYVVEIDDDPAFGSINYSATVTGTSHAVVTSLELSNRYYWRVRARNSCGQTTSSVFSFVTGGLTCTVYPSANVPLPIGPNAGTITNSTLNIVGSPTGIADLNVVGLIGTHTFVADLDVDLIGPAGAAQTRRIFDDVCGAAQNFNLNLDDAAALLIGAAGTCPITGGQILRPENSLAFFNGIDPNGTWTLRITDDANVDGGSLTGWGLRVCVASGALPVLANSDAGSVSEDNLLTVAAPGVLGNDEPAAGLTSTVVTTTPNGTLVLDPNGSYTYMPNANYCGTDSFVYQASDGVNTDTATVAITVACVNDLPTAGNDAYVVNEDTLLSTTAVTGVLTNDSDPVEGSTLTAVSASDPPNGSVVLAADGSFNYTPDTHYCGADSFTYRANDGTDNSAPATVTIDVTCINDAPVAVNDSASATEDVVLNVAAPGVLVNDSDVDNVALSPVFPTLPVNGSLALATNGGYTYTPNANTCGADSFTYRITDGALFSAAATVDVTVACVDDAPQAVADAATVAEDAAATDIDVLLNDTDVDAGPRSVQSVTQPTGGSVTVPVGGANVSFQPAANFCGTANFTYTLNGGAVGNVAVTVTCVNDAPTAVGSIPAQSGIETGVVSLATAANFADVDDATLSYGATGLPAGLSIDPATGVISGTIAVGAATGSPYTVVVTASDAQPLNAQQTFQFSVTPAAPLIFRNGFEN